MTDENLEGQQEDKPSSNPVRLRPLPQEFAICTSNAETQHAH